MRDRIDVAHLMAKIGLEAGAGTATSATEEPLSFGDLKATLEGLRQSFEQHLASLQVYRTPRLPYRTRWRPLKLLLLRIVMVCSRYQDLYNSHNLSALRHLNQKVEVLEETA